MTTLTDLHTDVVGGVDTHGEVHVAAALDRVGRVLATASFATTAAGNRQLLTWLRGHGEVVQVGVEGTGSWGAGLCRYLAGEGVAMVEVDRPNRQDRRRRGKSDTIDAEAAARAALNGTASAIPKARDGDVEAIRALRVVRRSAMQGRVRALHQLRALCSTAPQEVRDQLRGLGRKDLVQVCVRLRVSDATTPGTATKLALRELARRISTLEDELARLDAQLGPLVARACPQLLELRGVGPDSAAILLVTAGDNPHRLKNEASFAKLCGVAPLEASSGRVRRHRLNRGGDRQANHALWRIVLVRMHCDPRTRAYVARRRAEGLSTKEIMRCLKRYVAREIYRVLTDR
ncbi:MAG: IS110 family transposase [Actinomycetota bacterium]